MVGEERGPQNRGRRQEWTQQGLRFGEKAELGAQVQPRCRNSPTLPSPQAASQTPSCPEPDPFPSLGSVPFEVLSHCRAEAALAEDQKGEAPFPFTHFVQRLPLPRLHMPPGSWLLVTALHRHCLFFRVLGDPPHCPQGPLVSPAPSLPPVWMNFLSLLLSVIF